MTQYSWGTCPAAVEEQVNQFLEQLQAILSTNLVGLYLHGSLAMGCFNPDRSDIDLLAVTMQRMPLETKRQIAELLLRSSMAPEPIEISFLVQQEMRPFQHPLPFDLHYGESWRQRYSKELESGDWMHWNDGIKRDNDLSAHFTIVHNRGICLYGTPIREVFPQVPAQYYRAAIIGDFEDARDNREKMPVYFVLNACRVYAYVCDGAILSKDEGGMWGLRVLPRDYHDTVTQALEIYRGNHLDTPFVSKALDQFAAYMDERLLLKKTQ